MSSFDGHGNLLCKILFEPRDSLYRLSAANWCIASQRHACGPCGLFRVYIDIVLAAAIFDIVISPQQITRAGPTTKYGPEAVERLLEGGLTGDPNGIRTRVT